MWSSGEVKIPHALRMLPIVVEAVICPQAAVAEVHELTPGDPSTPDEDNIERWRAYWSRLLRFEDPNKQIRYFEGLRKAGLTA